MPPEVSCPVLLGIEQQNMKLLSCRLELAPRQWGIPQLAWQTYSLFCFGVISFGMGHKDHGKLASVTACVSNNLSKSKFGCLNLSPSSQSDFGLGIACACLMGKQQGSNIRNDSLLCTERFLFHGGLPIYERLPQRGYFYINI